MRRSIRKRFIPYFFSLGILCLGLELGARFLLIPQHTNTDPDPVFNHVWRPSSSSELSGHRRNFNDQSWLESTHISEQKPVGTKRWFFVGDSFTEGTCADEESVPRRIDTWLNSSHKSESISDHQVINTGTSSYSPTLYYLTIKKKIVPLHPDVIVIAMDMTDVFDDYLYAQNLIIDSNGDPIACPANSPFSRKYLRVWQGLVERTLYQKVTATLGQFSSLFAILDRISGNRRWFEQPNPELPMVDDWLHEPWSDETEQRVTYSLEMLSRAIQAGKVGGAQVIVTAIPHLPHFKGSYSTRPFNRVKAIVEANGGHFFDLYGALRAKNLSMIDYYLGDKDIHFNGQGYGLWSEVFKEYLVQNGFVSAH